MPARVALPVVSVKEVPVPAMLPVEVWFSNPPFTVTLELFNPPERVSVPPVTVVAPV